MNAHPYVLIGCLFLCFGCSTGIPEDALRLSKSSLEDRQMQTRRYETADEAFILSACAGLMQDMGFNLEESETELGIIVGSKTRSAVDAGQVTAAIVVAALFGTPMSIDDEQFMRCSIATYPQSDSFIVVRVTFQRIVWNDTGACTKAEGIKDPDVYQEFFDRLSKAIFLEGQKI